MLSEKFSTLEGQHSAKRKPNRELGNEKPAVNPEREGLTPETKAGQATLEEPSLPETKPDHTGVVTLAEVDD
ncbi:hypothetical protein YC2023_102794 [Brassica napus]